MEPDFNQVAPFVKQFLKADKTGHNFDHIERVANLTQRIIIEIPEADALVAMTAAYLHDVIDEKVVANVAAQRDSLRHHLADWHYTTEQITAIFDIIDHMSFSKNLEHHYQLSLAGQIVQDADRLDAIGAIGIARAFYYGGHFGEEMYDPKVKPRQNLDHDQYRHPSTIINHFYEKLLRLKEQMNTEVGKEIADERQKIMLKFLEEFKNEWVSG